MGVRGRTCLGCRRVRFRAELVRLVRGADGAAGIDLDGRSPGRGAYVCAAEECFERGRRRIAGALKGARVDPPRLREAFLAAVERFRNDRVTRSSD